MVTLSTGSFRAVVASIDRESSDDATAAGRQSDSINKIIIILKSYPHTEVVMKTYKFYLKFMKFSPASSNRIKGMEMRQMRLRVIPARSRASVMQSLLTR